jgi:MFS family permease
MFLLSKRFGAMADRYGPRLFMSVGPLVAAGGMALLLPVGPDVDYLTDLLPGLILFALGLSMTVAPLTATVLADADEQNAGIASGVNNAIARVAGLVGIAAVGAIVAGSFDTKIQDELGASARSDPAVATAVERAKEQPLAVVQRPPAVREATENASVDVFHLAIGISALLVFGGGLLGFAIQNPRREVKACDCPGGQLAGHPRALHPARRELEPAET